MKRGNWATLATLVVMILLVGGWKLYQVSVSRNVNAYLEEASPLMEVFGDA